MKKIVSTTEAPAAIGPYSQAVIHHDIVYTSGQIPLKADGTLVDGDVGEQARQVLTNLAYVLNEAGSRIQNVIKTTVYLENMDDFDKVNAVYGAFFKEPYPARCTVAVRTLPKNVKIEIEAIAHVDDLNQI